MTYRFSQVGAETDIYAGRSTDRWAYIWCWPWQYPLVWGRRGLTHFSLETPYGDRLGSTSAEVMAWYHQATSQYRNWCQFFISEVLWYSLERHYSVWLIWKLYLELLPHLPGTSELKKDRSCQMWCTTGLSYLSAHHLHWSQSKNWWYPSCHSIALSMQQLLFSVLILPRIFIVIASSASKI